MPPRSLLQAQPLPGLSALTLALLTALPASAQTPAAPAAAAAAASAPAPARAASAPPPASAASASDPTQRIQVTGSRGSDTEQRRQSTASKIVIGREEIDKFGDATVGEVLRRLPGVTTPGAPGRGGPPRMRGLGGGFTQLLIDGQRIPPGFSLESLTPEQVERIEILRAPTAETGARAIAGTINIITREGFRRRLNDVRIGVGLENGQLAPGVTWTHNDSAGDLTYNLSGSAFAPRRESSSSTRTTVEDDDGNLLDARTSSGSTADKRTGFNLTTRLQWRLGESGDSLSLMPMVFHGQGSSHTRFNVERGPTRGVCAPGQVEQCTPAESLYDNGESFGDNSFTNMRLGAQWRQRFGDTRIEVGGNGGRWRSEATSVRRDYVGSGGNLLRRLDDHSDTGEDSLNLTFKATTLAGGNDGGAGHSLVAGAEVEGSRRDDTRVQLQNGAPQVTDLDDNLRASALRMAAYAQDEWSLNPNWGVHAGLRWEGIRTRGDVGGGSRPTNSSSVWTPLLHAVYKPDPKGRDQVRFSLTRSYRSPQLGALIARPVINRDYPLPGANTFSSPDSGGNPGLQPELSTGVDIAIERYLESGGVLSANLFHRNISNLMRGVTALEDVSYAPAGVQRYVRRQRNVGDATTTGIELEARFRLDQLIDGALPLEVRSNLSLYHSRVGGVPGPDNRLDQQASASANLGADYRLRGLPLTLGGNVNWLPGYTTRLDAEQAVSVTRKTVWDAYMLWAFSPQTALRLLGSNLDPREYATTTVSTVRLANAGTTERSSSRTSASGYVSWQLRLELKL